MKLEAPMLIALVGCGPAVMPDPFVPAATCDGIYLQATTHSCAWAKTRLQMAQAILQDAGYTVQPPPIWVREVAEWHDEEGTQVSGQFRWTENRIEINETMSPMVHELFHAYQKSMDVPPELSARHLHWEENGYYALQLAYLRAIDNI